MTLSRRAFLASSVAIGAAAALPPARARAAGARRAGTTPRVRLVRSAGHADERFERGVRARLHGAAAAASESLALPAAPDLARWRAIAAAAQGGVLVGLVSEAEFVLVNELARAAGGRILCQGTHLAGGDAQSRHRFTTTASSAGIGASLARQLGQRGHGALIQEEALEAVAASPSGPRDRAGGGDHWAELLGAALADVAIGGWEPRAVETPMRVGRGGAFAVAATSHVSFVIAV